MAASTEGDGRPRVLRGWSSVRLDIYGTWIRYIGALMVFPLAAESNFAPWYGITFLCLALSGTFGGFGVESWAGRKKKREIAMGYTPYVEVAAEHPDLYWTDPHLKRFRQPGEASKLYQPQPATRSAGCASVDVVAESGMIESRGRRCVTSACPSYFVEVKDRACASCGNRTQPVPITA